MNLNINTNGDSEATGCRMPMGGRTSSSTFIKLLKRLCLGTIDTENAYDLKIRRPLKYPPARVHLCSSNLPKCATSAFEFQCLWSLRFNCRESPGPSRELASTNIRPFLLQYKSHSQPEMIDNRIWPHLSAVTRASPRMKDKLCLIGRKGYAACAIRHHGKFRYKW